MKKITTFIVFLLFFSCSDQRQDQVPDSVVNKHDLIPVIVDLELLESHFQRQFSRVELYRDALDSSSQLIFREHKMTKAIFEESIAYYASDPDTLFSIYEAALDTINFRLSATTEFP